MTELGVDVVEYDPVLMESGLVFFIDLLINVEYGEEPYSSSDLTLLPIDVNS